MDDCVASDTHVQAMPTHTRRVTPGRRSALDRRARGCLAVGLAGLLASWLMGLLPGWPAARLACCLAGCAEPATRAAHLPHRIGVEWNLM